MGGHVGLQEGIRLDNSRQFLDSIEIPRSAGGLVVSVGACIRRSACAYFLLMSAAAFIVSREVHSKVDL